MLKFFFLNYHTKAEDETNEGTTKQKSPQCVALVLRKWLLTLTLYYNTYIKLCSANCKSVCLCVCVILIASLTSQLFCHCFIIIRHNLIVTFRWNKQHIRSLVAAFYLKKKQTTLPITGLPTCWRSQLQRKYHKGKSLKK